MQPLVHGCRVGSAVKQYSRDLAILETLTEPLKVAPVLLSGSHRCLDFYGHEAPIAGLSYEVDFQPVAVTVMEEIERHLGPCSLLEQFECYELFHECSEVFAPADLICISRCEACKRCAQSGVA